MFHVLVKVFAKNFRKHIKKEAAWIFVNVLLNGSRRQIQSILLLKIKPGFSEVLHILMHTNFIKKDKNLYEKLFKGCDRLCKLFGC